MLVFDLEGPQPAEVFEAKQSILDRIQRWTVERAEQMFGPWPGGAKAPNRLYLSNGIGYTRSFPPEDLEGLQVLQMLAMLYQLGSKDLNAAFPVSEAAVVVGWGRWGRSYGQPGPVSVPAGPVPPGQLLGL